MYLKNRIFFLVAVMAALSMVVLSGCQKKAQEIPLEEEIMEEVPMPQVPSTVMIPEEIAGKWKAVVLELTDKDTNEVSEITVNIGETIPLADTGLSVFVEAFLPSFTMAGDVFTSSSADLNNPAARIKVTDSQGQELFYKWLFALYPATHPFEHPKYALILKDYVAAK
ncbi:MAG: DUF2155 domain-containing protein [bacterium]|nr:MAG: DUF2155 domain-containing protein [bacterium]